MISNLPERIKRVDQLFERWDKTTSPGCSLAVVHEGEIIHARGYGMANLEHGIPNRPDTAFYIASTSKQFTAACIALCAESGLLDLDDDVRKYVPELPEFEKTITIRHLVHHTSGLRDFFELLMLRGMREDELLTNEDILSLLAKQRGLNFLPGEDYLYSNSGYFLMGVIVERASGKTLRQFAQENIFDPLGMKNAHFHDDHREPVPRRATGYLSTPQGYRIAVPTFDLVGSGGIYATVEDLFLWDQNFYHNRLGKGDPNFLQKLLTPGRLNNGKVLQYAFGLGVRTHRGLPVVEHAGGTGGYRAQLIRFPQQKFSVILLANHALVDSTDLAQKVADIFLEDAYPQKPVPPPPAIALDPQKVEELCGMYFSRKAAAVGEIQSKDGALSISIQGLTIPLEAVSPSALRSANFPLSFEFQFKTVRKKTRMELRTAGDTEPTVFEKISPQPPDVDSLQQLSGAYFSPELESSLQLLLEEGMLCLKIPHYKIPLHPAVNNLFYHDFGILEVQRNRRISVSSGRAQRVIFTRTKK